MREILGAFSERLQNLVTRDCYVLVDMFAAQQKKLDCTDSLCKLDLGSCINFRPSVFVFPNIDYLDLSGTYVRGIHFTAIRYL